MISWFSSPCTNVIQLTPCPCFSSPNFCHYRSGWFNPLTFLHWLRLSITYCVSYVGVCVCFSHRGLFHYVPSGKFYRQQHREAVRNISIESYDILFRNQLIIIQYRCYKIFITSKSNRLFFSIYLSNFIYLNFLCVLPSVKIVFSECLVCYPVCELHLAILEQLISMVWCRNQLLHVCISNYHRRTKLQL